MNLLLSIPVALLAWFWTAIPFYIISALSFLWMLNTWMAHRAIRRVRENMGDVPELSAPANILLRKHAGAYYYNHGAAGVAGIGRFFAWSFFVVSIVHFAKGAPTEAIACFLSYACFAGLANIIHPFGKFKDTEASVHSEVVEWIVGERLREAGLHSPTKDAIQPSPSP